VVGAVDGAGVVGSRGGNDGTNVDKLPCIRKGAQTTAAPVATKSTRDCCLAQRRRMIAPFLYAFDLLGLGGLDLRPHPLEERKGRFEDLLRKATSGGIQFNEHIVRDGEMIFRHARKLGFEGIVSKHASPY